MQNNQCNRIILPFLHPLVARIAMISVGTFKAVNLIYYHPSYFPPSHWSHMELLQIFCYLHHKLHHLLLLHTNKLAAFKSPWMVVILFLLDLFQI